MKKLLIVLLLAFASPAFANFTKVQTGTAGTAASGTTVSSSLALNATAGNLVTINYLWFDGMGTAPIATAQDENGKTYTIESHNSGTTNISSAGYIGQGYYIVASGAGKTVTVTFNRTIVVAVVFINEWAPPGGQTVSYDNGAFTSGTSDVTGPSIPVAGTGELIIGFANDSDTVSAVSGSWVMGDAGINTGSAMEYQLGVSGATSVGFAATAAQAWNAIGMSFSASGGGGAINTSRGLLLGVGH